MKKTILTLAALFITWLMASAQLNFGIKGGYNSSLSLDNISSVTSGTYNLKSVTGELANGFHAGVFARVGLGDKLYIQPELLYALQKKQFSMTYNNVTDPNTLVDVGNYITFSTVDIPVLLGYKLVNSKLFNLRAFAGPKFRLNAGSKFDYENLTNGSTVSISALTGELKNSAVGLEVGAGVDVLMFTLDARMNLINDLYTASWQSKPDLNSNFVISLGWKF